MGLTPKLAQTHMARDLERGSTDYSHIEYEDPGCFNTIKRVIRTRNCKELVTGVSLLQLILFGLCIGLIIMGILQCFEGFVGVIIGVITIILGIVGIIGGFLAQQHLLVVYVLAMIVLLIFSLIELLFDVITISPVSLIITIVMTVFYAASAAVGGLILLRINFRRI